MGNKELRPSEDDPMRGFDDQQLTYLSEKFELVSNEGGFVDASKLADAYQCDAQEANRILRYIDFEGEGQVDFYEFKCAAASIHQNDEEAQEVIFGIYADGTEMTKEHFEQFFKTVYKYLQYVGLSKTEYSPELGEKKFVKYDFNGNGSISLDEFRSILQKDSECRRWMATLGFAKEDDTLRARDIKEEEEEHNNETGEVEIDEGAGDESGSTPPWIKTIDYMKPKGYVPPSNLNTPPSTNIEIEYVYGYRSYDTRNNLRYSTKGEAIYHTAGTGIVLNQGKNTMRTTIVHNDDITCLDTWKNLVVTGEMGRRPLIAVWDSDTMETIISFSKPLEKSISNVAFSPSGRYIAATSMSDNHEIAVYDITKKELVATGNGPRSPIFALKFTAEEDRVVCGCAKEVVFVSFASGKGIKLERGIFGKVPILPTYSLARVGSYMVSAMGNGNILLWKGNSCTKPLKEHNVAVTAMTETLEGGLVSADAEGNIVIWKNNLTVQKKLSVQKLIAPKVSFQPKVIAMAHKKDALLIGTRGGEVIEVLISTGKAAVIMEGHYDKELWGVVCYPNKNEFFTAGQDRLLIKWDIAKRRALEKKQLEAQIMSIDLNMRENMLAVGYRNGLVMLLDCTSLKSLSKISNHKNPDKEVLSLVKFSPSGELLAVAYCPPVSKVYLYQTSNRKKIGECRGSPSRITSIDFSMGGDFLLINNTSYEILFYNATNGSQMTRATQFQDQQWATMSCKFSWQCQGIWPHLYADGSDINTVQRSHSKQLLASGDDFSKIKLFRYPACQPKQFYNQYKGHSSHITGVKWSFDDRYLVSIGGLEKSVIQWKVIESKQDVVYQYEEEKQEEEEKLEDEEGEYDVDAEYEEQPGEVKKQQKEEGEFEVDDAEGDEIGAIKPFLGQIKFPSGFLMNKAALDVLPKERLKLGYAWGIRNQYINDEVRNQLKYNERGTGCLFITAAVGVEMDTKSLQQSFYNVQTNDLICLSVSADRKLAATGQMAQQNKDKRSIAKVDVHVWTTGEKKTQAVLRCCHKRAVVIVQFSPNGQLLLTIGQDDKNTSKIFNWRSGKLQWPEQPTSRAKATGACWKDNRQYATVGLDHIKFWSQGKGSMGKIDGGKWDPMYCVAYNEGKYYSGSGSGAIYVWTGGSGTRVEAHKKGKVQTLLFDSRKVLYSGGDDGSIISWKIQGGHLNKQAEVINMASLSSLEPGVLSLDLNKQEDRMLVCTKGSEIFEVNLKKPTEEHCLMKSHFAGELWACCFSPDSKQFVSAGDDKTLRVYDVESKKQLYCAKLADKIRGVDWQQSSGDYIVCGDFKGKIHLFDRKLTKLDQGKTLFSRMKPRQSTFWIEDIKFSPDGNQVAFGAHGGRSHIEVFKINDGKFGESFTLGVGFSSALLQLDWSRDSEFIMAVSQAYQLKFASVAKAGSKNADVSATSLKDEKWATWTCKLGFPVQCIWQGADYTDINTVCASPSRRLLATGGDDQLIRLFHYPVVVPKQKNRQYSGHASHVTRVRFSHTQETLISTGGNDRTTMLWIVEGLDQEAISKKLIEAPEEENQEEEEDEDSSFNPNDIDLPVDREAVEANLEADKKDKDPDDFEQVEEEGQQFMAVKPWVGAIKEPTKPFYKNNGDEPEIELALEYAHGYRSKDCRNNLRFLDAGSIVYHTAALGVVMKLEGAPRHQTFFDRHGDDILSIAWSEDRKIMYTGEIGANPPIYEWTAEGKSERSYKGIKKGVMALDCNEKYLIAASMDDDHTVCVFDRKSCKVVAKDKGGPQVILAMKFVGEDAFVTVGIKHFKMWEVKGATVSGKKGLFGKNCNFLLCVDTHENKAYVGAGDGSLQVWTGTSCSKAVKLHGGKPMDAVKCLSKVVLTGGKDAIVNIVAFDTLVTLATINCKDVLKDSKCPSVRAVDVIGNQLLIGTLGSEIYQITCDVDVEEATQETDFSKSERMLSAHFSPNPKLTNEVWGLTVPLENKTHFITCSDDATIRLWDLDTKEQLASASLDFDSNMKKLAKNQTTGDWPEEAKGRCIAVSREGFILVGCKDGSIKIFDEYLKPRSSTSLSKKEISDIKINREDNMVAIGSHDAFVYLCSWEAPTLKVKHRMKKHSSYITHLDFSCDGNYLHSTCGAYELLFWDTEKGQQCTSGATMLRDEGWYTWTTTLGWPVQGIWSKFMDGTDINAVDRSRMAYEDNKKYVATGNDRGEVRVFEYPCLLKDSKSVVVRGHSSHVTCVRFTPEDKYVISSGGADHTILQWRVVKR